MISLCKKAVVIIALVSLAFVVGLTQGCAAIGNTVTPPPTGPNHAGPNAWNREDSEKKQAFCYAEVLKVVRQAGASVTNEDLPAVRAMFMDCMNQNGGVI